ncbi:hypothetical protein L9F63_013252, partial [Diploptera punctata]
IPTKIRNIRYELSALDLDSCSLFLWSKEFANQAPLPGNFKTHNSLLVPLNNIKKQYNNIDKYST